MLNLEQETQKKTIVMEEARERLFGTQDFQDADPQMRLQMCMITTHNVLARLICNPSEQLEIDAGVAVTMLQECTEGFVGSHQSYNKKWVGGHMILTDRKQNPDSSH